MSDCLGGISSDVLKDCKKQPKRGLEKVAYVYNRSEVTIVYDGANNNLITSITPISGAQGYKIEGKQLDMNAGHSIVTSDTLPDRYAQTFNFAAWLLDSVNTENIDSLEDLIVVVESKNKNVDTAGDGTFKCYGDETGLYKNADDHNANDNSGTRLVTVANRADEESSVSSRIVWDTDYATTKAALEATLTPTP